MKQKIGEEHFVYVLTVLTDFSQAQAACLVNCFKKFKNAWFANQ